ncbi:helix-hairpin-helix domain-containing protein [Pueribacillus sp. YX66]|uniref:helix-hairpin-helix domain-containing protein n=1 Tax=Pueribacillus sp. YX66 TaxID=3229242 RepID=UPI00358D7708
MSFSQREKWLIAIIISMIIISAIVIYFVYDKKSHEQEILFSQDDEFELNQVETLEEEHSNEIVIDIKGAVKQPGVYSMNEGERVIDAIERAGGLLPDAEENQINLAGLLKDEMVIYVAKEGEELTQPVMQSVTMNGNEDGKVRINSATAEDLQKLQGIGPSKASAIIAYRDEHGPFKTVEDLLQVSGIGEKTLENMKDEIVID